MSLRRVDPASNCFRFYRLDIERDLFGQTVLARRWGRLGSYGRSRFDDYPDEEAARAALAAMVLAKQRRGYRDDMSALRTPSAQRSSPEGLTFEAALVDEASEPPLPF
jgi:predicted DNA-binding WGR domain protein